MSIEQLAPIAWPLAAVTGAVVFYRPLADFISGLTSVSVTDKNGKTIQLTASQVRGVARDLLTDVDNMISGLGTDEKTLFAAIRSSAHTPKVSQVIQGFRRGTKEHDSLRKLRDAQLSDLLAEDRGAQTVSSNSRALDAQF
jgi:hypothetical protein